MFTVIKPDNKQYYQNELHEMFLRRAHDQLNIDSLLYDHQDSVYIYFNDIKSGIYGSARLNPMTSKNLVRDSVSLDITSQDMKKVWECSTLSFHIEDNHPAYDCPKIFDIYCTFYYKMLHEALIKVCRDMDINILLLFNTSDELKDMKNFGHIHFDKVFTINEGQELSLAVMTFPSHQKKMLMM